jgi:hypothetical protein
MMLGAKKHHQIPTAYYNLVNMHRISFPIIHTEGYIQYFPFLAYYNIFLPTKFLFFPTPLQTPFWKYLINVFFHSSGFLSLTAFQICPTLILASGFSFQ